MRKVSIGPCPLCDKRIWKFKRPKFIDFSSGVFSMAFKKLPYEQNEEGTHVWFLLTDSTRMRVAICRSCLLVLTDDQAKQIFADITYTKLEAIKSDNRITDRQRYVLFDRVRTVEVWKWSENETELIGILDGGKKHSIGRSQQA